jgi:hypothetical protein
MFGLTEKFGLLCRQSTLLFLGLDRQQLKRKMESLRGAAEEIQARGSFFRLDQRQVCGGCPYPLSKLLLSYASSNPIVL